MSDASFFWFAFVWLRRRGRLVDRKKMAFAYYFLYRNGFADTEPTNTIRQLLLFCQCKRIQCKQQHSSNINSYRSRTGKSREVRSMKIEAYFVYMERFIFMPEPNKATHPKSQRTVSICLKYWRALNKISLALDLDIWTISKTNLNSNKRSIEDGSNNICHVQIKSKYFARLSLSSFSILSIAVLKSIYCIYDVQKKRLSLKFAESNINNDYFDCTLVPTKWLLADANAFNSNKIVEIALQS